MDQEITPDPIKRNPSAIDPAQVDERDPDLAALQEELAALHENETELTTQVRERVAKIRTAIGSELQGTYIRNQRLRAVFESGGGGSNSRRKNREAQYGEDLDEGGRESGGYSRLKLVPVRCFVKPRLMGGVAAYEVALFTWDGRLLEDPRDTFDGKSEKFLGYAVMSRGDVNDNVIVPQSKLPISLDDKAEMAKETNDRALKVYPRFKESRVSGFQKKFEPDPGKCHEFVFGTEYLISDLVDAARQESQRFQQATQFRQQRAQLAPGRGADAGRGLE